MLLHEQNIKKIGLNIQRYKPNFLFRNAHLCTMFPYGFRKLPFLNYTRERIFTNDGDFYDVDWLQSSNKTDQVIVLLHGLEGSAQSQYIKGLANHFSQKNVDVCAVNHRSCGGEMNQTIGFYHSGFTKDLDALIPSLAKKYNAIFIAGYSLGGNMALKYAGTANDIPEQLKAIIAFSVPCHLSSSAVMLNHWKNKAYSIQFLNTLNKKIINKARLFPGLLNENDFKNITSLREYDNRVTAPLHGFVDAEDYYEKSSSKQFLPNIKVPSLLINAQDDTFLAPPCFPNEIAEGHEYFHFLRSTHGGHVGFAQFNHLKYWTDNIAEEWFTANGLGRKL